MARHSSVEFLFHIALRGRCAIGWHKSGAKAELWVRAEAITVGRTTISALTDAARVRKAGASSLGDAIDLLELDKKQRSGTVVLDNTCALSPSTYAGIIEKVTDELQGRHFIGMV